MPPIGQSLKNRLSPPKTSFTVDMSPSAIGWRIDSPITRTQYFADMVRDREDQLAALEDVLSQLQRALQFQSSVSQADDAGASLIRALHENLSKLIDVFSACIERRGNEGSLDPFGQQSGPLLIASKFFVEEVERLVAGRPTT
jgi:hypothetical protein